MSRVHDALRRAEQSGVLSTSAPPMQRPPASAPAVGAAVLDPIVNRVDSFDGLLGLVKEVPFRAATDSLLGPVP